MNTVFLIGNGFDLKLGLKTKYKDFYEYYIDQPTTNDLVKHLKKEIAQNIENWSDFELAFGQYCEHLKTTNDLDVVLDDVEDRLSEYLKEIELKFSVEDINKEKMIRFLRLPEISISPGDRHLVNLLRSRCDPQKTGGFNYFCSFNYTRIFEKLTGYQESNTRSMMISGRSHVSVDNFFYIHGTTDNLILGVNDITQIKNNILQEDINAIEFLVKNERNKSLKHEVEILMKARIQTANLICVFGMSLGETDKIWWEAVAARLKEDEAILIIYIYNPEVRLSRRGREERRVRDLFLDRAGILAEERKILGKKNCCCCKY